MLQNLGQFKMFYNIRHRRLQRLAKIFSKFPSWFRLRAWNPWSGKTGS